jgi:hypothetical protein
VAVVTPNEIIPLSGTCVALTRQYCFPEIALPDLAMASYDMTILWSNTGPRFFELPEAMATHHFGPRGTSR